MDIDAKAFPSAPLIERAVLLLTRAFRDPQEPVSRVNVARAIAAEAASTSTGSTGGFVVGGTASHDPEALRLVSEAWQVLESARLICPDLAQSSGDWWLMTSAGRHARDSSDARGEIELRLAGNP